MGNINRPSTLPSGPGSGVRPGGGGAGERFPGAGDRPGIRPGGGGAGERFPGGDHRPGDRPIIGGGGDRRPGINNGLINNGNINIGNRVNIGGGNVIGNRPGWDSGHWNNPGWGWGGGGGWAGNWHDHCINPAHGWYNGCWGGGYWGSNWYAPLAWGAVGWGLGAVTSDWGYGSSYSNPYYVEEPAATAPYDYSQPVVVNNYVSSDASGGDATAQPAPETAATEQATKLFDEGLALFKTADYKPALTKFDDALRKLPGDPVVHEVRALTLFALGDYDTAAAALNSFLSSAPGMDWTTMSGLYGNVDDYQAQYKKLEEYCQSNPDDPASHFVLAYHDLVMGSKPSAIKALEVVVKNQPKDSTAKRMLDALSPAEQPAAPAPAPGTTPPETDLVGNWQAKANGTTIDLAITEDSKFTWKATPPGKPAVELKGDLDAAGDALSLQTKDKGSMAGSVKSLGPDQWQFALSGAPPSDPGLKFERVKN